MNKKLIAGLILCGLAAVGGCAKQTPLSNPPAIHNQGIFALRSSAFANNAPIPAKFTCDGADVSPAFEWSNRPQEAKSLALICQDPDAPGGTFTHWIVYNIPPTTLNLVENLPKTGETLNGIRQGKNDFGKIGYNGACPPAGKPHHYRFQLFALDTSITLKPGATAIDLENAIGFHKIATAQYIGTYQKK